MISQYPKVIIKNDHAKRVRCGYPWVSAKGIQEISGTIGNGDICTLYTEKEHYVATGYYNNRSPIKLRVISRKGEEINKSFFQKRIFSLKKAKEEFLPPETDSYRVVFGESDFLPGLVIDKYGDVLVIQLYTLGIDRFREAIVEALKELFTPGTIYERSDLGIRLKEGLKTQPKQLLFGRNREEILIKENGRYFWVNFQKGHKTGFFLDQRENRNLVSGFCRNRSVLNCFAYTGAFSVYAALAGAKRVTSVDISQQAIECAQKNFEANRINPKKYQFVKKDAFEYLKNLKEGEYDLIILDPPALAQKKEQVEKAVKAYITINSKALEKLPDNGLLVSSSCTTQIDEQAFLDILLQSSINTHCILKVLAGTLQPLDHPYNLGFPEGRYLKFFILQKINEL